MASPLFETELANRIRQAYSDGLALHGYLELDPERFADRVAAIIEKHSEPFSEREDALKFLGKLFTNDLYLAIACAQGREIAWECFTTTYRRHIRKAAESVCSTKDEARDLADSLPAHLFLPGRSERCRIASYCGLSSLATWLTAIIRNQANKERERISNKMDRLDLLPEIVDHTFTAKVETSIIAGKYESQIRESLAEAAGSLTEREKLLLMLRYEEGMKVADIAHFVDKHPSTVTRCIQSAEEKIREKVIEILTFRHGLSAASVDECLAEIQENPAYSILSFLKDD